MSDSPRKRRPLVADKRYGKSPAKPASGKKSAPARKSRRKSPRKPAPKRGLISRLIRWIFRLIWTITWRVTAVAVLVLALAVGYFYTTLPPLEALLDGRARGSVTMEDRDGAVFAWRGDQFGGVVTANSVSKHLRNAVIATEDKRFY